MSAWNERHPEKDNNPHEIFARAVRSLHTRRNAPPPIPIPINPYSSALQIATTIRAPQKVSWVAVELSNYPSQMTRVDIHGLFKDFKISPDFKLPNTMRLSYPLRTFILIAGGQEAKRAVRELSGRAVGGRQVQVKLMEEVNWEQKESIATDLTNELKVEIINTARVSYPHLAEKILEVRECVQGSAYFAFLQARDPVIVDGSPEAHIEPIENKAKWDLLYTGRYDGHTSKVREEKSRLSALRDLKNTVETQGMLQKVWNQWEGSWMLNKEH
ncbi:Nn.00g000850.m01.CDS01 [Neocucurbitaria sp. VM-36]